MRTFDGLRSRCTKPCAWKASTASASWIRRSAIFRGGESGTRPGELIERLALDVLEGDERVAERVVDAEDRHDGRMVERLQSPRLREEVTPRIRIVRIAKDLQRDGAVARFVVGAPDVGRAAGADVRRETVASGDDRADIATGGRQDLGDVRTPHRSD